MKNKRCNKNLVLKKKTIANLNQVELGSVKGGLAVETQNPTLRDCPLPWLSDRCVTFCLGNCLTYEFPTCPTGDTVAV